MTSTQTAEPHAVTMANGHVAMAAAEEAQHRVVGVIWITARVIANRCRSIRRAAADLAEACSQLGARAEHELVQRAATPV